MPLDPVVINDLRKRILANEPYTLEECATAVREMVSDRVHVMEQPKKKAKSTAKSTMSLDDFLP